LNYFCRTSRCRDDLGIVDSSKQVHQCKPYPEHLDHSSQVVKELKEREKLAKQEGREVDKRSLESGQLDNDIVVEIFGKRVRVSITYSKEGQRGNLLKGGTEGQPRLKL
jgi:hypothetical protein